MRLGHCLFLATLLFCGASRASATTVTVDATANIFGAGHATPPAPGGGGAGSLPVLYSFPAGPGQYLRLSGASGIVSCCGGGGIVNGPDGGSNSSGTTDILSWNGIAGIVDAQRTMFVTGVFLGPAEPVDPAPARLDFSDYALTNGFGFLSPAIGQTFFIGDGLTGTGTGVPQLFLVPPTATRLYLGFADASQFGDPTSLPGFYDDNQGTVVMSFDLAPLVVPTVNHSWGTLKLMYR